MTTPSELDQNPLQRVAVALDTSDLEQFSRWAKFFGPRVGVLKVGLQAFVRWGERAVVEARRYNGEIFLDLKVHDIPQTVAGAVRSAERLGATWLTVHAGGGPAMLRAAVETASEVRILGVTVLTHLDDEQVADLNWPGTIGDRVQDWAKLAEDQGCDGVVCSPRELQVLRAQCGKDFRLVTPGIREVGDAADDQKRTLGPAEAVAAGSDMLVIGRPLTRAQDPEAALQRLAAALVRPTS